MKKISNEEIKEICDLYKVYGSLRQIAKIKSRSLSTLHKYTSLNSVIKPQNNIHKIYNNDDRLIGTYVGLWMGDGTQYNDQNRYTIKICSDKRNVKLNNFIQDVIYRIFNKKSTNFKVDLTNQAYIKFKSKFIYEIIKNYAFFEEKSKTYSVNLKKDVDSYSIPFLEGCLLGLALSDGYLKNHFRFNVTSENLAKNMLDILRKFNFNPSMSVTLRKKEGFKDLHCIFLRKQQSIELKRIFDRIISDLELNYSFEELKYEYCENKRSP